MDFEIAKKSLVDKGNKIVFPEGDDIRIIGASVRLLKDKLALPILLGEEDAIRSIAKEYNLSLDGIEIVDPLKDNKFNEYVGKMFELRKGKKSLEECKKLLEGRNYYGTMMLQMGDVDALVGGATYSTADTIRPALQIVKTKPNNKIVSSCFLMQKEGCEPLIYADCGVNANPNSEELKDIAKQSAESARNFGIDPKVAFLSFSSKGSAKHADVDKVVDAVNLLKEENVDFDFDGKSGLVKRAVLEYIEGNRIISNVLFCSTKM